MSRRLLPVMAVVLVPAAVLLPGAAFAAERPATPAQPKGPFYPLHLPPEADADLATVAGKPAKGEAIIVTGRVLRRGGSPAANATVEIWQTNTYGRYHHERDESPAPYDEGFQGWGRTVTDAEGHYRFRTIRPKAYSGRAPHIHFAVTEPGSRTFYTQLYFAGAPENGRDFLYRNLSAEERERLAVSLDPSAGGEPAVHFDIVLP